jgi:hypothetical protein
MRIVTAKTLFHSLSVHTRAAVCMHQVVRSDPVQTPLAKGVLSCSLSLMIFAVTLTRTLVITLNFAFTLTLTITLLLPLTWC